MQRWRYKGEAKNISILYMLQATALWILVLINTRTLALLKCYTIYNIYIYTFQTYDNMFREVLYIKKNIYIFIFLIKECMKEIYSDTS